VTIASQVKQTLAGLQGVQGTLRVYTTQTSEKETRDVFNMSIATQMQKAIATVQSAAATMKTFALETQDQQAKKTFQQLAQTFDDALMQLEGRQNYIEDQEPQYKQQ